MAQVLYSDDHGHWAEEDGLDVMMCGRDVRLFARYLCPVYDLCKVQRITSLVRTKSERQKRRRGLLVIEARRLERQQAREGQ